MRRGGLRSQLESFLIHPESHRHLPSFGERHMKNAVKFLQNAVRLLALLLVALGFQFWSGRSFALLPVHMRMGEVLVALLWILAGIGLRAGVKPGLAIGGIVYGF